MSNHIDHYRPARRSSHLAGTLGLFAVDVAFSLIVRTGATIAMAWEHKRISFPLIACMGLPWLASWAIGFEMNWPIYTVLALTYGFVVNELMKKHYTGWNVLDSIEDRVRHNLYMRKQAKQVGTQNPAVPTPAADQTPVWLTPEYVVIDHESAKQEFSMLVNREYQPAYEHIHAERVI